MRLDGFGIFVERMPTMVRFYRDVLGFEIREDENASNVYLEKMTGRRFGYAGPVNGHYEIALCVENHAAVDAAFREVVAKGARPVMDPTTEPWGQRTCYVADPEGNLIEIGSFKA